MGNVALDVEPCVTQTGQRYYRLAFNGVDEVRYSFLEVRARDYSSLSDTESVLHSTCSRVWPRGSLTCACSARAPRAGNCSWTWRAQGHLSRLAPRSGPAAESSRRCRNRGARPQSRRRDDRLRRREIPCTTRTSTKTSNRGTENRRASSEAGATAPVRSHLCLRLYSDGCDRGRAEEYTPKISTRLDESGSESRRCRGQGRAKNLSQTDPSKKWELGLARRMAEVPRAHFFRKINFIIVSTRGKFCMGVT